MKTFWNLFKALKNVKKASEVDDKSSFSPSLKKFIIPGSISAVSFLIVVVIMCAFIFAPVFLAYEFFGFGKHSSTSSYSFCGKNCGNLEKEFYDELGSVQNHYGDVFDANLITGTIFYGYNSDGYKLYEVDEDGHNKKFIDLFCGANGVGWLGEGTCKLYVKHDYEDVYNKYKDKFFLIATKYESLRKNYCEGNNTPMSAFSNLIIEPFSFNLDSTAEELCELYLWHVADLEDEKYNNINNYSVETLYKEGKNEIKTLASKMYSGGNLDYTKYRKYLIDTYIPVHFSNLYTSDYGAEQIASEIMKYASYKWDLAAASDTISASCSQITLKEPNGDLIPHELEEYVAGVVTAENGGAGDEALKIQAIAARSFAVKNCDRVIVNSINGPVDGKVDQAYKAPSEKAIKAAEATRGKVFTYNNEIFEVSFASYPMPNYRDPNGFPGYYEKGYLCSDVKCSTESDGRKWCTTTLYKQPNMESFELKMPEVTKQGSYWNGLSLTNQQGHCYGISQLATTYYENELNYTHEQMVDAFLSPGVKISSIGGFSGDIGNTDNTDFLPYELNKFLGEKGSSIAEFNKSIKQAVVTAGPGTREGVVASVNALVNGLSQYGIKLPYISSVDGQDRGKYRNYGVDPQWGTNGSYHSSYYHHTYVQLGLDCSGLVSWAIHNGGFKYLELNSTGFKNNVGTLHTYGSFKGQPGDLLVVDGHIGIIVGVTDSQYIIAEEHGWQNGLEITYHSLTSDSNFKYVIDMTSYYSNSSNMDLSYYQGG